MLKKPVLTGKAFGEKPRILLLEGDVVHALSGCPVCGKEIRASTFQGAADKYISRLLTKLDCSFCGRRFGVEHLR